MKFRELDEKTLRKLQLTELGILKEIDKICNENDVPYYLVGGTLIGAIRHNGFIPWDDDIDIGMLRKDYDKFLNICKNKLSDKFYLQSGYDYEHSYLGFSKIRLNNTMMNEENIKHMNINKGIFVDIFPLDNVKDKFSLMYKVRFSLVKIIQETIFYKYDIYKNKNKFRHKILSSLFLIFKAGTLRKIQDFIAIRNDKDDYKYCGSFFGAYSSFRETYEKKWIFPTKKHRFEDGKFSVPNNYDVFLKNIYNDYMTLPPVEERVNHSLVDVSFDLEKDKKRGNK